MRSSCFCAFAAAIACFACSGADSEPDASPKPDASTKPDAEPADAEPEDADLSDAEPDDADLSDAEPDDADLSDAEPDDTGAPPDAGAPNDAGLTSCTLPARDAGAPPAPDAAITCNPLPWTDPVRRVSLGAGGVEAIARSNGGRLSRDSLYAVYETYEGSVIPNTGYPSVVSSDIAVGEVSYIDWSYDQYEISADGTQIAIWELNDYLLYSKRGSGRTNVYLDRFNMPAHNLDEAQLEPNGRAALFRTSDSNMGYRANSAGSGAYVRDLDTNTTHRIPEPVALFGSDRDGASELYWKQDGRAIVYNWYPLRRRALHHIDLDVSRLLRVPIFSFVTDTAKEQLLVTALALDPADLNGIDDAYVIELATGIAERASVSSSGGEANQPTGWATISEDGRFVAFESTATNLVADDVNGTIRDVFVRDRRYGLTYRLSSDALGSSANAAAWRPEISGDGRGVIFYSSASNLIADDTNAVEDVFVAAVPHVECTPGFDGGVPDAGGGDASVAPVESTVLTPGTHPIANGDGRSVIFWSRRALLSADTNAGPDLYAHDVATGVSTLLTAGANGPTGAAYAVNRDGTIVAFFSDASNLVANDTNDDADIFIHDRSTGTMTRIPALAGAQPDGESIDPSISADGRYVAFESTALNFDPTDTNAKRDIYVVDLMLATFERVSKTSAGLQGNDDSRAAVISGDGLVVAFDSRASNLIPVGGPDTGIYVHDRATGTTEAIESSGSTKKSLSFDGRMIAFDSYLTDVNGFGRFDVWVYDRVAGTREQVSVNANGDPANGDSHLGSLTPDGRYLVFWSDASDLVAGDTNGVPDVFVKDLQLGSIARVSVTPDGREGSDTSAVPFITADARFIVYASVADELGPHTPHLSDVILAPNPLLCSP